jgi:Cu(I)/Ag(I) efflux system membrane fusion protein
MRTLRLNKREWVLIGIALALGLILGGVFFNGGAAGPGEHAHDMEAGLETIWTCSMHPQIRQNEPGKCPICAMDLVPVESGQSTDEAIDPDEIQMSEAAMKLADVQTTIVRRGAPRKSIHLLGKVKADERKLTELTARFGGRIEKLSVNFTGQQVRKGETLGKIYSPDLITAQKELLESVPYKKSNPAFYQASRNKLKLWDLTDSQIRAIESEGEPQLYFEILSPISGTVMERHVAVGDYVKAGSPLFKVTDLTSVWVMLEAYESDLPWISINDPVVFTVQSLSGKSFSGKVAYIDPFVNASTRIVQVRVDVDNPKLTLKP